MSHSQSLVLDFSGIGISSDFPEAVNLARAHRVENAVLYALVSSLKACEKLLHIFALGCVILGTWGNHNWKSALANEVRNVSLGGIKHGAYKRNLSV